MKNAESVDEGLVGGGDDHASLPQMRLAGCEKALARGGIERRHGFIEQPERALLEREAGEREAAALAGGQEGCAMSL